MNSEFGQISSKDVEVAKYLDMVHSVKLLEDHEELTLLDALNTSKMDLSDVQFEALRNNQQQSTELCNFNVLIEI